MDERKRSLRKEIVRLALPIALQQFMTALVGACDAIMLGKLSQDAMSAVSLATQVTFVFNLFMFAFMAGENMFVAQYYGKGDYTGISQVFSLVTKICGCIAVVFLAGTLFFPEQLMRILTNEETLIVLGSEYLRVIGISYVFSGIAQIFLAIMKNCGAVNMSTLINGVMVILNIALNAVFIFGLSGFPKMGIKGAALATVLATDRLQEAKEAGGDSKFGMLCDSVTLWCIIVPLGCICAFILKLPVMVVYFVLNLDEIIKLPVVYKHYKKYKWIKNLT